jgi:hypothetical protein
VNPCTVTAEHLRRLATVDRLGLFRDADTLVLSTEGGIMQVPLGVVEATLEGRSSFVIRMLYSRGQFADDGVITGRNPRAADGRDLDAFLASFAACLNDTQADSGPY